MRNESPWPHGKSFAFTIFDDPDSQTLEVGRMVYSFLADLGFRTTKAVWPMPPVRTPSDHGATCGDPAYRDWCRELQALGFEIAFHNATSHTSTREETLRGLDEFRAQFGHDPHTMANHYFCDENIYHGQYRVSGVQRLLYNILTMGRKRRFAGHVSGSPLFWGDLCASRIRYVRNFVFAGLDTLASCPLMPYHDPDRSFVKAWFAASEGSPCDGFVRAVAEDNQDALERERGAAIVYTHFAHGFVVDGKLDPRFRSLMERLSKKNGWFVPVHVLLDRIAATQGIHTITHRERSALERRWLLHKIRHGTA